MAAKKPAAKATKPKKTVVKKAAPAKKPAPVKKPAVAARTKTSAPAKPAPAAKPAAKPAAPAKAQPVAAAKPAKAAAAPVSASATRRAEPPAPEPTTRDTMPLRSVSNRSLDHADAAAGDDEAEGQEPTSTSLLAGPRNVKPYVARRGEQYMNKEQLEHFRNILETWKRDLMQEVDRTVLHMKD